MIPVCRVKMNTSVSGVHAGIGGYIPLGSMSSQFNYINIVKERSNPSDSDCLSPPPPPHTHTYTHTKSLASRPEFESKGLLVRWAACEKIGM